MNRKCKKSKVLSRALRPMGRRWCLFHSPQPDTCRSRKTTAQIRGQCIAWYARLLPSFRWYLLPDPGGMARWVGVGTQQPWAGFEPATVKAKRSPTVEQFWTPGRWHQQTTGAYQSIMSIGWVDRQQERVVPSSTTCANSHVRRLVRHSVTKKKLP